ncbi:unnamed protein product [Paramecium sonneborni]|uniref:Ion transport domain-containing protein n=1 Tax=Paramecium sonneborni TaxID=65129 RepID=A0A8S1LV15_9CILI|nr:unnamed protein product [Paramecium sonneborni]
MSLTLKKLGIEYKEISLAQANEASQSIRQMRLEQILVGDCENFGWQNLINRHDLIQVKNLDKTSKDSKKKNLTKTLFIFSNSNPLRKGITQLIQNQNYKYFIILIAATCLIPYCINEKRLAISIEVVCNIIFGFDILLFMIAYGVILDKKSYLRDCWNIVNVLAFIFTWFIFLEDNKVNDVIKTIRILRLFRLIQEIPLLRIQFTAYVSSFLKLKQVLIPIFLVMIYFAIIGLHLFIGLTEKRCRITPEPIDGVWLADDEVLKLCGIWECPENLYCGSPVDHNLPKNMTENDVADFSWDFIRFDDFFHSLLVVFTFLNVTGWSGTTFMFWKAMTTYVTATYFLVLIVLLAFILSNLLLALFYESFMEKSSIKNSSSKAKKQEQEIEEDLKKKNQEQLMNRLALMSKSKGQLVGHNQSFNGQLPFDQQFQFDQTTQQQQEQIRFFDSLSNSKNFNFINNLCIILSALAIIIDYKGISKRALEQLQMVDFFCIVYSLVEMAILISGKGLKGYFSKDINKFDFFVISSQWILIFVLVVIDESLVINHNVYVTFFKSLKILRVFRFVYNAKLFYTITLLMRSLVNTLTRLKSILALWACLVILIAVVGKSLLQDKLQEEEMTIYYDDFGSALMAAVNIFYNEEWHVTMYKYARHTYVSFFYSIFSVILGQIFFIRLLMAVFLNEFVQQLKKIEEELKPIDFKQFIQSILQCLQSKDKKKNQKITKYITQKSDEKNQIAEESEARPKKDKNNENRINSILNQNVPQQELDELQNWLQVDLQKQEQQEIKSNLSNNNVQNERESVRNLNQTKSNINISKTEQIVDSFIFQLFALLIVLASTIRVGMTTPFLDPNSDTSQILKIVNITTTILFIVQIILNIIARGFIIGENSYIQRSPYNILNVIVTLVEIISLFAPSHTIFHFFSSLRIIEFIRIGALLNTSINYISQALLKAFQTMIQLSIFCFIILLIYGTFATKILKGAFFYCSGISNEEEYIINDKWDCLDHGGSWINRILGYDNIFDSALTLFVTATTEAWLEILIHTWSARGVDLTPQNNNNRWWAVYFQVFFFIGNICMLNMFISLVVETYQQTKIKAQGMSELDSNQREWLSIKQSINHLKPRRLYEKPKSKVGLFIYSIAESKATKYFWHALILLNTFTLALYYDRQDKDFIQALDLINLICTLSFTVEVLSRVIAKFPNIYDRDPFIIVDVLGIIINLVNQFSISQMNDQFYLQRGFEALSVGFQLLRNYYIIKRFPELEKLFHTIFSVVPSALSMLFIMFIFLFIFACLGMDLFGYLRPQNKMEGFDLHFKKFTTAMFSLIRVASSEEWWALLIDSVRIRNPDFACIYINNYEEFQLYGYNGCGTHWAYVFYVSFHLIFSLVILNLFIASILGAYEEHAKQEQSAISKYQLHDVLNYWAQYDPKGTGFLNYKQFWKLSSEIAICFGVPVKELLDPANKKNFLKALNIPLYEDGEGLIGYLFHDVIVSLTRLSVELKYGVRDLESDTYKGKEFVHQYYKKFKKTPYYSGQMSTMIYLQAKARMLINKKKGVKCLDIGALKQELQCQNDGDKFDNS